MSATFTTRESKICRGIYFTIFGEMPKIACEIPGIIMRLAENYKLNELDLEQLERTQPRLTAITKSKISFLSENFGGLIAISHTISRKRAEELSKTFENLINDFTKLHETTNEDSERYEFYSQKIEDLKTSKQDIDRYLKYFE